MKVWLINKIFLQIFFTIKKHNMCCKNYFLKNSFVSKFRRLIYFFLRYHTYFFLYSTMLFIKTNSMSCSSTVKIIYYYKLFIKMIWNMKNYLMIHLLVSRFYEFKILLIRIFRCDCRWICRLITPLLISTTSK